MSKNQLDNLKLEKEEKSEDTLKKRNILNRISDDKLNRYIKLLFASLLTLVTIIVFIYISKNYLQGLFSTIGTIFTAFLIAFLLSILLDPILDLLDKAKIKSDTIKAGIVTILFLALIILLMVFVIVPTIRSIILNSSGNEIIEKAQATIEKFMLAMPVWATDRIQVIIEEIGSKISAVNPEEVAPYITSIFGGIAKTVLILLYTLLFLFFMLKERDKLLHSFSAIVPKKYKRHYKNFVVASENVFRQYIKGHFTVILSLFMIALITFIIIGLISGYTALVKYAFIFALILALTDLIPYVGPWIGGAIVVVLSTFVLGEFGIVLVLFIAILGFQVLENAVLQPIIMGNSVSVHPLGILTAMLIFTSLGFGIIGVILAAPIVSLMKILGKYIKEEMEETRLVEESLYNQEDKEKNC